ncbi:MAG: PASTA domain-containing protein [Bacteroidaceae bacterium]|nr:PASTA domain-containing protein [Bacteroidaceae bacterium]
MSKILKRLFSPIVFLNLGGMALVIGGLLVGLWFWMEYFTHHGEGVDVPNVKTMMYSDACYTLSDLGLIAVVLDSAYNKDLPAGCVLEQTPGSGSRVKEGREIYLTINNRFVPTLPVPDIADNCSLREAEAKLKALGFKLGPTEYVPGDRDWVLDLKARGVSVSRGDRVPIDVPIVLVVGNNEVEFGEEAPVYDSWTDTKEDQTDPSDASSKEEDPLFP